MLKPIFIFSQPRAGSTLLQKILMSHKAISSMSEPWILLPLVHIQKEGQISMFSEETCRDAVGDVIKNLNHQEEDYNRYLHDFVMQIYQNIADTNSIYFLDKTPRYYLIIDEIMKIFPEAKFIFLFRHPLSVYGSIISTFNNNKLRKIYKALADINEAPLLLAKGIEKWKEKSYQLQYEKLVASPEEELKSLFLYLELEFDSSITERFFTQNLQGNMGDPTGSKQYRNITQESLKSWKKVFSNPFRKQIAKSYIESLDDVFFIQSGYSKETILKEINSVEIRWNGMFQDMFDWLFGIIYNKTKFYLLFSKRFKAIRKYYLS